MKTEWDVADEIIEEAYPGWKNVPNRRILLKKTEWSYKAIEDYYCGECIHFKNLRCLYKKMRLHPMSIACEHFKQNEII